MPFPMASINEMENTARPKGKLPFGLAQQSKKSQKAKRWLSATALTFAANLFPDFFSKKDVRKRLKTAPAAYHS